MATTTHSNEMGATSQSIRDDNNASVFSLKINKEQFITWTKRIAFIGLFLGYIAITIMSYSVNPEYFWALVKAGVVLSLVSIIALSTPSR
ncbi:hypothetical protein U8527_09080 [Kordia algicida OT-1]|uniref:Uncharacterized protein n=1 Tax=Kordia algicida OT-1 TaxID=391587 RepID=A9DU45_9FLAO|nr:hypothetical protein [Kordia algicida]EDP96252.1 hypothetical protein KAOT1_02547 [Kordia algicida OT-1]